MSKLNEDIIIRYLENRCSEEDFVLINEWMKESDENAGELFRMEEIYQLGKFPFEEENLVAKAERRLGRRLEQENQKRQEVFKLKSVLRYAAAIVGVIVLAAGLAYWFRNKAEELVVASAAHGQVREMLLPDGTKVWLNPSNILSVTMLEPLASASATAICGCISVGKPGYGSVLTLVLPISPSAITLIQSSPSMS